MTESSETSSEDLATCHGIIGHPDKPKFLAIRHSEGWAPPTVKFAPGSIAYRATMVTDGILRKYGLLTRVLRPVLRINDYHCLELELVGRSGKRRLDAVWVGEEEYERFKSAPDPRADPFVKWLEERRRDAPHPLRAPWEQRGWFDSASHWIDHQLNRLQIQSAGSVEQFRIGWNASCLLRVPTSQGNLFFKASYRRPPPEAAVVTELAKMCPDHVDEPLAVDLERNWMLMRDVQEEHGPLRDPGRLPDFARALAEIQVASVRSQGRWKSLGCPVHDLDYLAQFAVDRDRWGPRLQEGGGRLDHDEVERFAAVMAGWGTACRDLAELGVPHAVLHADFRIDNLALVDSRLLIIDWADVVIGHPFLALERIFGARDATAQGESISREWLRVEKDVFEETITAYLGPFEEFVDTGVAREALDRVRALRAVWRFSRMTEDLDWIEPGSVRYVNIVVRLQSLARDMLRDAGQAETRGP